MTCLFFAAPCWLLRLCRALFWIGNWPIAIFAIWGDSADSVAALWGSRACPIRTKLPKYRRTEVQLLVMYQEVPVVFSWFLWYLEAENGNKTIQLKPLGPKRMNRRGSLDAVKQKLISMCVPFGLFLLVNVIVAVVHLVSFILIFRKDILERFTFHWDQWSIGWNRSFRFAAFHRTNSLCCL